MKTKKLLAMLLVLVMAICVFPASAFADIDDITFQGSSGSLYHVAVADESYWVGWRFLTSGNPVRMAQAYLYMDGQYNSREEIDGFFGNKTETAIRGYQYNHGLSQDGVVGENTWRNMYASYNTAISTIL